MQQRTTTITRTFLGLLGAAAFALASAEGARASTLITSTGGAGDATCWVDLDSADRVCVDYGADLLAAVEEQAGVVLEVPDGAIIDDRVYQDNEPTGVALHSEDTSVVVAASTVVAILYDDINYGGGSLVLSAAGACGTYGFANLGGSGWNDRMSSYRTYASCRGTAYRDINFGGTATATTANAAQLGSMNDRASSFRVTR